MMRLVVWAILAYLAVMMLMLVFPALLALVALCVLISKRHPDWAGKQLRGLGNLNGKAWESGFVVLVHAIVIGFGAKLALGSLGDIAGGHEMLAGMMTFLLAAGAAGGGMWFFLKILNGEIASMKNIFDLVDDDKPGMESFIRNENTTPVFIDINPERDIPKIKEEVIGQDAVVEESVRQIARRVRQNRKGKPLAVLMYVGSSGAGKSELAKSIAKTCFGGRIITVAMNQCKSEADLWSLIGSPKGYHGAETYGSLTGDIKKFKSGVILLDEYEKGHPGLHDAFMMLMDEGRIQEKSTGEFVDATKFVIIMTSNCEQKALGELPAKIQDKDELSRAVKDTLQSTFKPEQLARINSICCFAPLDRRSLGLIAGKFLFKSAASAEIELVGLSKQIMVDVIERHEKNADYGIRNLMDLIESQVLDQFYEVKDAGFKKAALRYGYVEGERGIKIIVNGVDDEGNEHVIASNQGLIAEEARS